KVTLTITVNAPDEGTVNNVASATSDLPDTNPADNTNIAQALTVGEADALTPLPAPSHVVLVIEENHSYNEIIGSSSASYINGLASNGALMTNSFAIEHPSQPNYLDLFSGSNQGVTDDTTPPAGSPYSTADLGGELINAGLTFGGFSEDLPSVG